MGIVHIDICLELNVFVLLVTIVSIGWYKIDYNWLKLSESEFSCGI